MALLRWARLFGHAAAAVVIALSVASWFSPPVSVIPFVGNSERFDPALAKVGSVDELIAKAVLRSRSPSAIDRVFALEQVIDDRFYHGYSVYTFHDNWVAWLAARTIHPHIDRKVLPSEILRHPWAACSQQAIVVQRALKRMGLPYGVAEYPDHFAATAFIDGKWYLVDPWGLLKRDRSQLHTLEQWSTAAGRKDILLPDSRGFGNALNFEAVRLARVNSFPAPTMAWFHPLSQFLSNWLILAAAGWLMFRLWRPSTSRAASSLGQAGGSAAAGRESRATSIWCQLLGHKRCRRNAKLIDGDWISHCLRCRTRLLRLSKGNWRPADC